MLDGFLPFSRASFMLDVVAVAMVAVVPVLGWSIYLVKYKRNFILHKRIQLTLGCILLAAVLLFEIDMRLNGWNHLAKASRYYDSLVYPSLYIHLCSSISTTILWVIVIIGALRRFARKPAPNDYSPKHTRLARWAAIDMYLTALTGWTFYVLAFVM